MGNNGQVMQGRSGWGWAWALAAVVGLTVSYLVASMMSVVSPVVAVAERVISLVPGRAVEAAIDVLGHQDKPFLVAVIVVVVAALSAVSGMLARRTWWVGLVVVTLLAGLGALAVLTRNGAHTVDVIPVVIGYLLWLLVGFGLGALIRRADADAGPAPEGLPDLDGAGSRRAVLLGFGAAAVVAVGSGVTGRLIGGGRRRVEKLRSLLRISGVTQPVMPRGVRVGVADVAPWMTPADDFYLIDTAVSRPAIDPKEWQLRIHGMVEKEIVIGFEELLDRGITQGWITLSCVSNEVGGDLVGNAWWSGIPTAELLAEAGVRDGADAVLQTSYDGWDCGTPLAALTDDRNAMLAVAMNGRPLPIDHGFPVRTVVPGLFGYVSACKWVVDWEVTRFADISPFWVTKGWSEQGPVKLTSRIEVPSDGETVTWDSTVVAGVAWCQHTGIEAVEVSVDNGAWERAELGEVPNVDTWVQWRAELAVPAGDHTVRARAIDRNGEVQTAVVRGPVPNGATGLDEVSFIVAED